MAGGWKNKKVNPFAQKKRNKKQDTGKPNRRAEPYPEIIRENELFFKYYQAQKVCPESEWTEFVDALRRNLPTTFRITAYKEEAEALLNIVKNEFLKEYINGVSELHQIDGEKVELPVCLPWYPKEMAWQLHLSRKDIRRSEQLFKLHNFLIAETSAGSISRQEAVSMIPPLVLDVKPSDKVLDMCASPGSKTAQLIEALHAGPDDKIPSGFVVANDVDNNRCYMLVHQAKRLNSPCFVVTNHDSCFYPNFILKTPEGKEEIVKFDKILCDVPCSGDGTMRKNPDIWTKWNAAQGINLHGVQYRIIRKGAELLSVGGRLVYSTCSLNPIENEAVLQRIIKDSEGALEIVDATKLVPGLKFKPGLTDWKLASKAVEIFTNFEEVPEKYHTIIRPNLFPLPKEEIGSIHLERCIRVLPHQQDTGAFFVAVIEKRKRLPWEEEVEKSSTKVKPTVEKSNSNDDEKSTPTGPQRKRRRLQGYREDPYIFFEGNEDFWDSIKTFYDLSPDFDSKCLLTRCRVGKKKNIYFCSEAIKNIVVNNEDSVKIINTGVKTFVRCNNRHMKCEFRLAQEGLHTSNQFIGGKRRITLEKDDLIKLLQCSDPTRASPLTELSESTQKRAAEIDPGSCVLKYMDEKFILTIAGWRGTTSLRAYVEKDYTIHMLRLLGADLSSFEINKFKKVETVEKSELDQDSLETPEDDLDSTSSKTELNNEKDENLPKESNENSSEKEEENGHSNNDT